MVDTLARSPFALCKYRSTLHFYMVRDQSIDEKSCGEVLEYRLLPKHRPVMVNLFGTEFWCPVHVPSALL